MATRDDTFTQFAGLLINDERMISDNLLPSSAVAGESVFTENTRRPGLPEYDRDEVAVTSTTAGNLGPQLSLEATGDQAAADYHIKFTAGGMPGTGADILYRPALDTTASWRGYNTVNVIERMNSAVVIDRLSTASGVINFGGCRTADGQALFVYGDLTTIKARKYDPATSSPGSEVTVADSGATMNADTATPPIVGPVVDCVLTDTGRLICYALVRDIEATSQGDTTMFAWYSDDNGATWLTGSTFALDTLIDDTTDTVHKLRAAYHNGEVCIIITYSISGPTYYLKQIASTDGLNFQEVEDWQTSTTVGRFGEIIADTSGRWSIIYWDTSTDILVRSTGSPFTAFLSAPASTITAVSAVSTDIAVFSDIDGTHYVTHDYLAQIFMTKTVDGGATWQQFATVPTNTGGTAAYFIWYPIGVGSTSVWAIADTGGALGAAKMLLIEFGGWTQLTEPRWELKPKTENQGFGGAGNYDSGTWIPTRVPDPNLWGAIGTSAMTINTTAPFGGTITTTASTQRYTTSFTSSLARGLEVFFSLTVLSTPILSVHSIAVDFQVADGTDYYSGQVRFSDTQVQVYDVVATAVVAAASNIDMTTRQVFKVAVREVFGGSTGVMSLYHRSPSDDNWVMLLDGVAMTQGTAATTGTVSFGDYTGGSESTLWHFVHFKAHTGRTAVAGSVGWFDDLAKGMLSTIDSDPGGLYGRPLPASPRRAYITGGLHLSGIGGPATRGDTYKIVRRYDYPISNIFTDSPSEVWRSVDTSALVRIAIEPSAGGLTHFGASSYGLHIEGANFETAILKGWDGAAWQTIVTLLAYGEMTGLPYLRDGNTLTVNTAVSFTAADYIKYNGLAGTTLDFGGGVIRRVLNNTEGAWTDQTTKRPSITFSGTPGTVGASGTFDIWRRGMYGLIHDDLTTYEAYAIEIPSGSTVDGYFQIGAITLGPAAIFATKYAHNRVITTEPNTEITTSQSGRRSARKWGPARTIVEASWVEGINMIKVQQDEPVPDFVSIRAAATEMMGAVGDGYLLEQINTRTGGGEKTLSYIPKIPITGSAPDTSIGAGQDAAVYGRLLATTSRETTVGEENTGEVIRLTGLRIESEI